MKSGIPDRKAALELFRKLGFRQLIAELETAPEPSGLESPAPEVRLGDGLKVDILDSEVALRGAMPVLEQAQLLALDTETDGLDPRGCRLVGLSLAVEEVRGGYYIPVWATMVPHVRFPGRSPATCWPPVVFHESF